MSFAFEDDAHAWERMPPNPSIERRTEGRFAPFGPPLMSKR